MTRELKKYEIDAIKRVRQWLDFLQADDLAGGQESWEQVRKGVDLMLGSGTNDGEDMPPEDICEAIIAWSTARNIIAGSTPQAQFFKLCTEVAERFDATNLDQIIDAYGDAGVCALNIAKMMGYRIKQGDIKRIDEQAEGTSKRFEYARYLVWFAQGIERKNASFVYDYLQYLADACKADGTTLLECLRTAYAAIKDRKGKMINGIFVKDAE